MYVLFNSSLPASCTIGKGTVLAYGGIGIVIHARTVIGRNCMISQNITIGGKSGWYEVPVIGDNVHISAGARILGPIQIGNNVIIGANAVVVKDVPNNCIVAGVPAKIIKEGISMEDYEGEKAVKYRGDSNWPMTPKA
jgi:serine O-acetyltransferase